MGDTVSDQQTIDRQSPVPYYQQVADVLEQRIADGRIPVGERLPSENDLCTEFGLARATIRQALQHLEGLGVAQRIPNRGVFAARAEPDGGWTIQNREGFLENAMGRQNRSVTTTVLSSSAGPLPDFAARLLRVPEHSAGFELVRLRHLDDVPALYSVNYSPPAVAAIVQHDTGVLHGTASLSELLTRNGYPLRGAHRTITALPVPLEIAAALQLQAGSPVLRVQSTSWTRGDEPFDVYETWVRTDVIPLEVNVSTVSQAGS